MARSLDKDTILAQLQLEIRIEKPSFLSKGHATRCNLTNGIDYKWGTVIYDLLGEVKRPDFIMHHFDEVLPR